MEEGYRVDCFGLRVGGGVSLVLLGLRGEGVGGWDSQIGRPFLRWVWIYINWNGFWVQGVVMLEVEVGAELRLKAGIRFGNG